MSKDGATVVLFKNDRREEVFLVFRSDFPIWVTTGGAMEQGESPKEAALREAKEETDLDTKITRYVGKYLIAEGNSARCSYLFEGRVVDGEFRPEFPGCKGGWFPVDNLPFSVLKRHREKIRDSLLSYKEPFERTAVPVTLRTDFLIALAHPLAAIKYLFSNLG